MSLRAIIFDMDGVLVDSYEPHFISWQKTAAARGLKLTREKFAELFGCGFQTFAEALGVMELGEERLREWDREKEELYRELVAARLPVMPGVVELIGELAGAGLKCAVGSSGPRENVEHVLAHLPGGDKFCCYTCGDDVPRAKPAPDVFLLAAEKLGEAPANCVVIEDSLHGLEAARKAGMLAAVGLCGTEDAAALAPAADLVVKTLEELSVARLRQLVA